MEEYEPRIVGFFQKHLCERGTTIAMYDYALANEQICGNVSIIFYYPEHPYNSQRVIDKFQTHFILIPCKDWNDVERFIQEINVNYLYIIKHGANDGIISSKIPCLIHAVFSWDPHGNYATVSKTLAEKHNGKWLPHIVNPLPFHKNGRDLFREKYGIPKDAYVYGRYGGRDTFSINYVKEVIREDLDKYPNIWFVFVNTDLFILHPRVLFLPSIIELSQKGDYIQACDAMIHGRMEGETFGLAVAEFISGGKPVLTCKAITTDDNEHIKLGKDWIYQYNSKEELRNLLWKTPVKSFEPLQLEVSRVNPYTELSSENVMRIFGEILGDVDSFTNLKKR